MITKLHFICTFFYDSNRTRSNYLQQQQKVDKLKVHKHLTHFHCKKRKKKRISLNMDFCLEVAVVLYAKEK